MNIKKSCDELPVISCSKVTKRNCSCKSCTPYCIENKPSDLKAWVPIRTNRLLNCANIEKFDTGINQPITFTVDNTNTINYTNNSPVCIKTITLLYDFIGLSGLQYNNLDTFIDGSIYTFTPENKFTLSTNDPNNYLFDSAYALIKIPNHCCENQNSMYRKIRIVETGRYFEVANLVIKVSGCIGDRCFTATGALSSPNNQNVQSIRLTSLGIISSATFDSRLCITNRNIPVKINEIYTNTLTADCIRPSSNYTGPSASDNSGSFTAYIDYSFYSKKTIYITEQTALPVLINSCADIYTCQKEEGEC